MSLITEISQVCLFMPIASQNESACKQPFVLVMYV